MKKTEIVVNKNILNTITPDIEFEKTSVVLGENYVKILVATNYPSNVKIAWLSKIANIPGVVCSIHLNSADPGQLVQNMVKSAGELSARLETGGNILTMQRTAKKLEDVNLLIQKIDQEQESVFYMTLVLMVTAKDKESVIERTKRVESILAGSGIRGRIATFRQEDALLSVSPYNIIKPSIKDIAARNMPVSTVAASFPFVSSHLNDGTGFILGKDTSGGIILWDLWKRGGDRTNSNFTLIGASGVGKSTAIKHIAYSENILGTKIIIMDPEREYRDLCKNLGGQWINCGGGGGEKINPLQIVDAPKDEEEEDNKVPVSAMALHFQTLKTFFNLYLKDISDIDRARLEETIEILYKQRNIDWNTDISNIKNEQYPILSDLYELLLKRGEESDGQRRNSFETLAELLGSASKGADSALWNGHTTVEAKGDFIVLDTFNLQEATDKIKRTQFFNILTWVWQQINKNRNERIIFIIDEAHLIIDSSVPQALQYVQSFSKRIRKYGGALGIISQSVVDFLDPAIKRCGQSVLDNPCFKLIMGADGKNLEELTELYNLTEAEQEMLAAKKRGVALFIAGSKRLVAKVELADGELEMFGKGGGK